jgi:hypothetical protein
MNSQMINVTHGLKNSLPAPSGNRNAIDMLRVRFWYEFVRRKINRTTAYQIELYFKNLNLKKNEVIKPENTVNTKLKGANVRPQLSNKWARYEKGQTIPRKSYVVFVNDVVPGSAKLLDHPLWELLKLTNHNNQRFEFAIERLDARVQEIVYTSPDSVRSNVSPLKTFSESIANRLIKYANLDSLTAVYIYWLISQCELQKTEQPIEKTRQTAQSQARCIYQILLTIGSGLYGIDVGVELFSVFRVKVFECTPWEYRFFAINEALFLQSVHLLNQTLDQMVELQPFSSWNQHCQAIFKIIKGKGRGAVQFGLDILFEPDWYDGPPTRREFLLWKLQFELWVEGRTHLLCRELIGLSPNDRLWENLDERKKNDLCLIISVIEGM